MYDHAKGQAIAQYRKEKDAAWVAFWSRAGVFFLVFTLGMIVGGYLSVI